MDVYTYHITCPLRRRASAEMASEVPQEKPVHEEAPERGAAPFYYLSFCPVSSIWSGPWGMIPQICGYNLEYRHISDQKTRLCDSCA